MELNRKIIDLVRSRKTQLPTLPVIVEKILRLAGDDRTSATDLAEFISKDQAIANKILKLSNSAYYGLMKEVETISRAITIIGFNEVVGLTIGMSVFSTFRKEDLQGLIDMRDLWLHSIGCALAAKEIAKKAGCNEPEQVFLNGLLHDMGKVILAVYFPEDYRPVLEDSKTSKIPLHRKEKEWLGVDHAKLSGLLMENWHFPDAILMPCRFHHDPVQCPKNNRQNAVIVELANFMCKSAGIGNSGNLAISKPEGFSRTLGISVKDADAIGENLKEQRPQIEEFLEIIS